MVSWDTELAYGALHHRMSTKITSLVVQASELFMLPKALDSLRHYLRLALDYLHLHREAAWVL